MMKHWSHMLASVALAASLGACATTDRSVDTGNVAAAKSMQASKLFKQDNVLILLASEQEANELTINVSRRGYQLIDRQNLAGLDMILLDFARPPGISDEVAVNDMQMMSPAAVVGLDNIYTSQASLTDTSERLGREYANDLLGWPAKGCRAQTAIGIIDGYLSDEMRGLNATQIVSQNFASRDAVESKHAETVASLISGPGRLRDVMFYSADVVGESQSGRPGSGTKELLLAFDWLRKQDVRVVNVSLAGPYNPLLETVVELLVDEGMVIVAAVGNEGPESAPRYPAAFESVIAVTAIDADRNIFGGAVQGMHVEYAAPGVDVLIRTGQSSGSYVTGTSFAAPFVTAMIAADASRSFDADAQSVRSYLDRNTHDLGAAGPDPVFGRGMVRTPNTCALYEDDAQNGAPS